MDTLKQLVSAMIYVTQLVIILRFVILCCEGVDLEDPAIGKQQKRKKINLIIAFIGIICVYDIPKLVIAYLSGG